jgi:alkane 1-monooxygenase
MATLTARVHGHTESWRDKKRYLYPLSLAVPLLPLIAWVGATRTGSDVWWFAGPIWILLIIPLLDQLVGADHRNAPDWAYEELAEDRYYRVLTYLFIPLQFAGLIGGAYLIAHGGLSPAGMIGLTLTVGAVGGIGIANAHELGHKKGKGEKWLGKVVLAQTAYGHFEIEHNRGHHAWVATPKDPASSRFGESFWVFLPRSVIGSAQAAWKLEKARFDRLGKSPWSVDNDVLNAWALSVVLFGGLVVVFGAGIIPFLVLQAVFGFSLLEVVNYLEHYGLLRQQDETGRYERCQPRHSWNSDHVVSNVFLYGLERHSDHHANPTRRFQTLRTFDEAPQLPSGYGGMIALAYVPPLWRKVMDRRVLALYGGDVTKTNIDPRKRERVLARYGSGSVAPVEG